MSPHLQLASFFLDNRGHGLIRDGRFYEPAYYQDRVPIRDSSSIEGHAVRAVYLMAGVVDVYLETGEDALLAAATTAVGRHGRTQAVHHRRARIASIQRKLR